MTAQEFIKKWGANTRTERAASQSHFNDLCELLGLPKPLDVDPTGDAFTFEKGATKLTGGEGFADVWKKHCFAWEYKGKHGDLDKAYAQLKRYADALDNPPLLIVSDMRTIVVHTAFTNAVKQAHTFTLNDLEDPAKRQRLKQAFINPEEFRPGLTRAAITADAARKFSELAHALHARGFEPHTVAHFLNRLVFCMFAEDVEILPNKIFSKMVKASVAHPITFQPNAKSLFAAMAKGGVAGFEQIDYFNGGLFDDDVVLPLEEAELRLLDKTSDLDWSNIEPSIFGTLFERGLDPDKRSQQGAHYTDVETIMKIVRPVVIEPWERAWEAEKAPLVKLLEGAGKKIPKRAADRFNAFLDRLHQFRVLDPACGSGNFLYLALRSLKNFEKRVIQEAEALGFPPQFPAIGPASVFGIEINPYAAELARVSIWIGELQWQIENGFQYTKNPILKPLNQIEHRDSVLTDSGSEAQWPVTDVIIGNPPFLGAKLMNRKLGKEYTEQLRKAYFPRLKGFSDLACYWFEKARTQLNNGQVRYVGLVATSSIRGGTNRPVLDAICSKDVIFDAWSEQPWVLEGARVEVSLICFAQPKDRPQTLRLDGKEVANINPDLTTGLDVTGAKVQPENDSVSFLGIQTTGPHDIDGAFARKLLLSPVNPNGKPNSSILKPYWNGDDPTGRPRDRWLIDYPLGLAEAAASAYQLPFEYLRSARYAPDDPKDLRTLPEARATVRDEHARQRWWEPYWPRPEMRARIASIKRYIVTPETAQYRLFVWLSFPTLPDKNLIVIGRDDDVTFGILHSRIHEVWSLRLGTSLEDRPRYTSTTTFATFPFPAGLTPNIPASDYLNQPKATKIADAAKRLNELREQWLNPSDLVVPTPEVVTGFPQRLLPKDDKAATLLKKRTLTDLYNEKPAWLSHAHHDLNAAVANAYGWSWPMTDDEVLTSLFALNQERMVKVVRKGSK